LASKRIEENRLNGIISDFPLWCCKYPWSYICY
jgi:hypothetical protein